MSRFDRYSRITPHERYRALERRAWGSLCATLLLLAAMGFCGALGSLPPRAGNGPPPLHGFWYSPPSPETAPLSIIPSPSTSLDYAEPPPPDLSAPPLTSQPPLPQPPLDAPLPDTPAPPSCVDFFPLPEGALSASQPPVSHPIEAPPAPATQPPEKHPGKQTAPTAPANTANASAAAASAATPSRQKSPAKDSGEQAGYIPPAYREAPKPPYPPDLRQRRVEGSLRVSISIDNEGVPTEVRIIVSSGHAEFDTTARRWILEHWRFTPARREGTPVAATVTTSIHFVLE